MITINTGFALVPAKAAGAKLNQTDWAVLHAICLHADKDGRAFPSMARIAEITRLKRYNVAHAIKRIEATGIMRHQQVPGPNGGWRVNHYELVYEPLGHVVGADNISAGVLSAETTGGVVPADNIPAGDVVPTDNTCCSSEQQGVVSTDTLTTHLTNQGTALTKVKKVKKVGGIDGAPVVPTDNTPARAAASTEPSPGKLDCDGAAPKPVEMVEIVL